MLSSFAPSYQTGSIWGSKLQGAELLHDSVSGASSLVCTEICFAGACFRSKLPRVYWLGYSTREHVSGACFRSKLPRVYWLEYLPGSVFRERFQEQAPSYVPALNVRCKPIRLQVSVNQCYPSLVSLNLWTKRLVKKYRGGGVGRSISKCGG